MNTSELSPRIMNVTEHYTNESTMHNFTDDYIITSTTNIATHYPTTDGPTIPPLWLDDFPHLILWAEGILGVLILSANILALLSLTKAKRLQMSLRMLLGNMVVSDTLVGGVFMYNAAVFLHPEVLDSFTCTLRYGMLSASVFGSMCNVALLALDRCLTIMYPYRYPVWVTARRMMLVLLPVWVVCTGFVCSFAYRTFTESVCDFYSFVRLPLLIVPGVSFFTLFVAVLICYGFIGKEVSKHIRAIAKTTYHKQRRSSSVGESRTFTTSVKRTCRVSPEFVSFTTMSANVGSKMTFHEEIHDNQPANSSNKFSESEHNVDQKDDARDYPLYIHGHESTDVINAKGRVVHTKNQRPNNLSPTYTTKTPTIEQNTDIQSDSSIKMTVKCEQNVPMRSVSSGDTSLTAPQKHITRNDSCENNETPITTTKNTNIDTTTKLSVRTIAVPSHKRSITSDTSGVIVQQKKKLQTMRHYFTATKTVTIILITFFGCNAPLCIILLYLSANFNHLEDSVMPVNLSLTIMVLNSLFNPIIYAFRMKQLRIGFLVMFCKVRCRTRIRNMQDL